MNFVNLFYSDDAVGRTAKSNLLGETEIKRYSLPSLMGNTDFGASVTNEADEISTKLFSSFVEC